MGGLASINIRFTANLTEFSTEIQNASRKIKKIGGDLQNLGAGLSIGITAPILAFGTASALAFNESAKAIAQVETALKSTAGVVGFNSEQLQKMAADLQSVTLFDDDEILKKATANLLTFDKISGDTFKAAQEAALDLATRLDGDLQTAALQIGKALQDPVKGIGALSKAGVSFSQEQKATIKAMVATNDVAGAQAIILKELQKQFGGSAEAAAKAGTGSFVQLKNQVGDLSEEFGKIIVDALKPFVERLKNVVSFLQQLSPEAKKTIAIIAGLAAVIGPLLIGIGTFIILVPNMVAGFVAIKAAVAGLTAAIAANPIGALAVVISLAVGAFIAFNSETSKAKDNLKGLSDSQIFLRKVTDVANSSIVEQKAKIESLFEVARDETKSKKERLSAIKELNRISPEYLGNLKLETIGTDDARKSVDKFTEALTKSALAKAANNLLSENAQKRIQASFEREKALADYNQKRAAAAAKGWEAEKAFFEENNRLLQFANEALERKNTKYDFEDKILKDIITKYKEYLGLVDKTSKNIEDAANPAEPVDRAKVEPLKTEITPALSSGSADAYDREIAKIKEFQNTVANTPELVALAQQKIDALEFSKSLKLDPSSVIKTSMTIEEMNQKLAASAAGMRTSLKGISVDIEDFNKRVSESFTSALGSFAEGFAGIIGSFAEGGASLQNIGGLVFNTLGNLAIQVGKIAIATGIAVAGIKKALQSLNPAIAIAGGVALIALGTLVKSQLSDAGSFANGGIVSGSSFYGDRLFARVNSGEMILNTKQQRSLYNQLDNTGMAINIGVQDIVVEGDKLRVVMDRNNSKRNRLG